MDMVEVATPPEVISFNSLLVAGSGGKVAATIPDSIGKKLTGMEKVEGIINGQPFRAMLDGDGGNFSLRVNQAMLRGAEAKAGDTVQLAVLGPEPDPEVPADLQKVLEKNPDARATWQRTSHLAKLDWVRWLNDTGNPETRARRLNKAANQLSEGETRPCCVNFYAYMLKRMDENGSMRAKITYPH